VVLASLRPSSSLQEVSYRFPNGNSEAAVRRELTQRIGIDLHESGLAVGALPTARIGRKTDKLARRQSSIDPLGTVASAIAAVSSGAGRIVTGVNAKHCASRHGLQVGSAGGTVRLLYDRANFLELAFLEG